VQELRPDVDNATLEQFQTAMAAKPNLRNLLRNERMVLLWIIKYNHGGIDALISKPTGGRRRKVALQRLEEVLVPMLKDPAQAAIEHWTGVKVHGCQTARGEVFKCSPLVKRLHGLANPLSPESPFIVDS
jgi:hypothetical protein